MQFEEKKSTKSKHSLNKLLQVGHCVSYFLCAKNDIANYMIDQRTLSQRTTTALQRCQAGYALSFLYNNKYC